MTARRFTLALGVTMLLSACGGGGDGGNSGFTPPTNDFAALAGWQNLLSVGGAWTVSGIGSDGLHYRTTLQYATDADAAYPPTGATYARSVLRSTTEQAGQPLGTGTVEFFRSADFRLQAVRATPASGAAVCSDASASALPAVATRVAQGGALATLDDRNGCLPASPVVGSTAATWSIEFERGIVLLCLTSASSNALQQPIGRESDCVEIAADGRLGTRARIALVSGTFSLTMRNF